MFPFEAAIKHLMRHPKASQMALHAQVRQQYLFSEVYKQSLESS